MYECHWTLLLDLQPSGLCKHMMLDLFSATTL